MTADPGDASDPRRRPFASWTVPPWVGPALRHPEGQAIVVALGWLMLLAGAGSLAWMVEPQIAATVGSSGFTYDADATATLASGWLAVIVIFGPLLGFNLVYWYVAPAARVRHLSWLVALFGVELLGFVGCVVWIAGADYPAGAVLNLAATNADAAIGFTGLIVVCLIAAGIMLWLNTSSTYEQQRDEYLYGGRTTVATTKVAVRTHAWWVAGLLAPWALLFVPFIASHTRTGDGARVLTGASTNLPWPVEYTYDDYFDKVLAYYSVLFAVAWSLSLSLLIEKVLYRGRWAERAALSKKSRPSGFARIVVKFRHWPFAVGATVASLGCFTPVNPDDSTWPNVVLAIVVAAIGFAVGLLFFRWEWKARDVHKNTMRLHLAGS